MMLIKHDDVSVTCETLVGILKVLKLDKHASRTSALESCRMFTGTSWIQSTGAPDVMVNSLITCCSLFMFSFIVLSLVR